jgi:2-keto-4-pentenoate hydratase/2-oxohepta-3-ene-1,7-dioic acid hydratase in catechol pathway
MMGFRLAAEHSGRAVLCIDDGIVDLERVSAGAFGPDPIAALARAEELRALAERVAGHEADAPFDPGALGPSVPRPQQVFAIGLNYHSHAAESGLAVPTSPMVFTKFSSSLAGPNAPIPVGSPSVDWEAELVLVIGTGGRSIPAGRAWAHVAGVTVGQDVSDRGVQFADTPPQFSMGKSFRNFAPIGPAIVSLDLLDDPNDLAITCDLDGERVQDARSSDMVFGVPALIEYLSSICELYPGDLVFTGTPAGVGMARGRFLAPGHTLVTTIEGVGTITNVCVAP